jgi:acid phosphatase
MFAEEHYSQGNYFWLFSGSNQNVGFVDEIPSARNHKDYPFKAPNLGEQLLRKGLTFKGYAESLPAIGSTVDFWPAAPRRPLYVRKHVPWISFGNVPNGTTAATSANLRFEDFPRDAAQYAKLPTVAFVIPNVENDMHTGSVPMGDRWLKDNLDGYYQWAKKNNSLLILTFDENNDQKRFLGLTDPFVDATNELVKDIQNRVATIFAGAHVRPGNYAEGKGITHVNILRTLEAMYGLPRSGAQQPNAARGGISDDYLILDVFTKAE